MKPQDEIALLSFSQKVLGKPFVWGDTDCCSLTVDCFDYIRGTNHKQGKLISSIVDKDSALKLCAERTAYQVILANGFQQIELSKASRGDIIYFYNDGFESLHICYGDKCLSSSEENGVHFTPTKVVLRIIGQEGKCFRCLV
tara:strand:- start:2462 stop:2887 length:426 start_codon:yes stop_codon:yes gene_type:complete